MARPFQSRLTLFFTGLFISTGTMLGQEQPSARISSASEYAVKATYLLNFVSFVQWPAPTTQERTPFNICILGDNPFQGIFEELISGRGPDQMPVSVRHLWRVDGSCQILYISGNVRFPAPFLRQAGAGVLTVGEGPGFLTSGGMIEFVVENRRVRFDVNLAAALEKSLRISSRLLDVARRVQR